MRLYSNWRHDLSSSATLRILLRIQDGVSGIQIKNVVAFGYRNALDQVMVQSSFLSWSLILIARQTPSVLRVYWRL